MIKKLQENKNKIIFIVIIISLSLILLYANNLQGLMFSSDNTDSVEETNISQISLAEISDTPTPTVAPAFFYIEVLGEVNNPGIFKIEDSILVFNAIELAGGYTADADIQYVHQFISLSKKVTPEQKIYIPAKGVMINNINISLEPTINNGKFLINTATSSELEEINGIGKVTAEKIIKNRPFSSWEELKTKTGIRQSALEELQSKAIL